MLQAHSLYPLEWRKKEKKTKTVMLYVGMTPVSRKRAFLKAETKVLRMYSQLLKLLVSKTNPAVVLQLDSLNQSRTLDFHLLIVPISLRKFYLSVLTLEPLKFFRISTSKFRDLELEIEVWSKGMTSLYFPIGCFFLPSNQLQTAADS